MRIIPHTCRNAAPAIRTLLAATHGPLLPALALLALSAGPAALVADLSAAESNNPDSLVLTVEGKVETARRATGQWIAARTNQALAFGDQLRTGRRSRATLQMSDRSVQRVDELTVMEIQPPQRPGGKPLLDLKAGATYFFNREKPTEMQFRAPVASGAIRGTEFHLAVADNGRTELTLLDGEVTLSNPQGEITLQSGEQAVVEPGQAPRKSPALDTINIIQWVLYYPAVLDPDEINLSADEKQALADSLTAYRSGDLLNALDRYPANRQPASDAERIFRAALLLAVGQVPPAETSLSEVTPGSPLVQAVREVIAAVKHQTINTNSQPATGSEWLARSYYLQSRSQLESALQAARRATEKSPRFGAAWIRVAELEFSFGRTRAALTALNQGLELSPRNAQGLALKGFLLSAQNKIAAAREAFDQAIAVDGGLGNAWLGRGLIEIRNGKRAEGRRDLQVAATLEPQRSVLRSYLGKAWHHTGDPQRAEQELALAKKLDPNDPTPWLYSALLEQQENRVNEAVRDLEKSKELNDNRRVYRSRLLLDQDRSVRSANLAAIYRDAGMTEVSVREATQAVDADYANYSAHLFLADSYDALRDPKLINLRYETPWYSEWLVANLLAPAGGGPLSQNISQQEYARLFDADHLGLYSQTEYQSRGNWVQSGSQYGNLGSTSYALDAYYRSENGWRPNNDLEQLNLSAQVKQQLTPQDSVFFQASYFDASSGDLAQYYNQHGDLPGVPAPSHTERVKETQEPNLLLGYHHEWAPGSHTLLLAGRFDDTLRLNDSAASPLYLRTFIPPDPEIGNPSTTVLNVPGTSWAYQSRLHAYSVEWQQIWQTPVQTLVAGVRYQSAGSDTSSDLERTLGPVADVNLPQSTDTDLNRVSLYAYEHWRVVDPLRLTVGLSYDRLHYPVNIDTAPITDKESTEYKISPKAGILWSPAPDTHLRGAYTRSLGGVFFDQSIRLEPVQVSGFNQAFRSLIPESVVGLVPGTHFETFGLGLDQRFRSGTYLTLEGNLLRSKAERTIGLVVNSDPTAPAPDTASSTRQSLDYEEKSLMFTANQLLSAEYSLGASYRLTHADLVGRSLDISPAVTGAGLLNPSQSATLHQVYLYANYNHRKGFFAQLNGVWSAQSNRGYSPDIPGDDFWQANAYIGYRFLQRRAELRVGLMNIFDRDYRLNPLTLYSELPRERTFAASFKFFY